MSQGERGIEISIRISPEVLKYTYYILAALVVLLRLVYLLLH